MKVKKKECAGFDNKKHQAYIYKQINGKKYCKFCAFKLQLLNQTDALKSNIKTKAEIKKELFKKDKNFYFYLWTKRYFVKSSKVAGGYVKIGEPKCENPKCNKELPNKPNLLYFHHILEKRNYPELRYVEENIAILCADCHSLYETYPDKVPYLTHKRDEILLKLNKSAN